MTNIQPDIDLTRSKTSVPLRILFVQYVEVYAVSLILFPKNVLSSYLFSATRGPTYRATDRSAKQKTPSLSMKCSQYTTVQRFIVILPSCTLKPDEHSICICAMFAHKQFHLTRNVAAISSVYQSMKSSKRPFFFNQNLI